MTICDIKTLEYFNNIQIKPVVDSSLVLWVTADNGDLATWINNVPGGNNGTINDGTREQLHPIIGSGVNLPGKPSVLSNVDFGLIPLAGVGTGLTVEIFAKINQTSQHRALVTKGVYGGAGSGFYLGISYLHTLRLSASGTGFSTSVITETTGNILHICGRIDNSLSESNANIFLNGLNFATCGLQKLIVGGLSVPILIGANSINGDFCNMVVYETRIYTRPLTDTEIYNNYASSVVNYVMNNTG